MTNHLSPLGYYMNVYVGSGKEKQIAYKKDSKTDVYAPNGDLMMLCTT